MDSRSSRLDAYSSDTAMLRIAVTMSFGFDALSFPGSRKKSSSAPRNEADTPAVKPVTSYLSLVYKSTNALSGSPAFLTLIDTEFDVGSKTARTSSQTPYGATFCPSARKPGVNAPRFESRTPIERPDANIDTGNPDMGNPFPEPTPICRKSPAPLSRLKLTTTGFSPVTGVLREALAPTLSLASGSEVMAGPPEPIDFTYAPPQAGIIFHGPCPSISPTSRFA